MGNSSTVITSDQKRDAEFRLGSCQPFETIVAHTCTSIYELMVLDGGAGDVLVRGGKKFPEFRRVWFAGSTAGGSALKMNSIDVGLRMEFHTSESVVITSPVVAVARPTPPAAPAGNFSIDGENSPSSTPPSAQSGVI